MDYSAVSGEADALHGASPWGSSSPRAGRDFPTASTGSPESPTPVRGHSYNPSQDSVPDSPYLSEASGLASAETPPSSQAQPPTVTSESAQPIPQNQQEGQAAVGQGGQAQQRPGVARYHGAKQQRPVPQYKLQAKVTALERTGRKDPVIRFDVHVCFASCYVSTRHADMYGRPTCPSSEPLSSEMSAEPILNLSNWPTT